MLLRYILTEAMLPPGVNLLLLLAAALLWRWSRRVSYGLVVLSLSSLLVLSIPAMKCFLYQGLEPYPALDAASLNSLPSPPQAIVVLAGGIHKQQPEYGRSVAGGYSVDRLLYGAELQRATGLRILLSGGNPAQAERSEAEAMAELLRNLAIEPDWVESNSLNTWENAMFSAEYLKRDGVDKVLLVTSAWHLPRAVYCFRQAGIEVIPAPTGFEGDFDNEPGDWVPSSYSLYLSSRALREYLGMLAYRVGLARPG